MHMPAVKAKLCLAPEISTKLHDMLCTLRAVKSGPDQHKLKSSAFKLPRLEPWSHLVSRANPILQTLLLNRAIRQSDAITSRGERGDGQDLKPTSFMLRCPHCDAQRGCAKVRLYAEQARCINCNACKRNTTSTRSMCSHSRPWHQCAEHREIGFRCGASHPPPRPSNQKA